MGRRAILIVGLALIFLLGFSAGCGGAPSSNGENGNSDPTASVQCENPPASDELRGVWVTNVDSDVLDSRANIEQAMAFLADHNFNVVYPVVWNDAATMYPSTVRDTLIGRPVDPQYAGRDPLAELVEAAHAEGLAVIPWFEFGFAASYKADGGPILEKYPSWAARGTSGALVTKNGFDWMNGYKPAVQDLLMDLIHPQVYRRKVSEYKSFLATQRANEAGWNAEKVLGFYPGLLMKVGDYRMTPEELKEVILTNRRRGINGEVFFFYEGLRENDGALADVLKSCYSEPADLPFDPAHVP